MKLDDMLMKRAELAFDELVNKMIDDDKRSTVDKTWYALTLRDVQDSARIREVQMTVFSKIL